MRLALGSYRQRQSQATREHGKAAISRYPRLKLQLKSSLCKGLDHVNAMKFGLIEADPFDPVQHIDLNQCTIVIDSFTTNMAMYSRPVGEYPTLRGPATSPILESRSSPWYRGLGGHWDTKIKPVPPTPDFDTPLLSLDLWVSGQRPQQYSYAPLQCSSCYNKFTYVGLLVRYCRDG